MIGRRQFVRTTGWALGALLVGQSAARGQFSSGPSLQAIKAVNDHSIPPVEIRVTPSIALDFDSFGNQYVLDRVNNTLTKYSGEHLLWKFGGPSVRDRKRLNLPSSMTTDSQGRVYVTDKGNSRVLTLSSNRGKLINVLRPTKRMRLNSPQDLAVANGRIYVADTINHQVDIYKLNGRHILSFGGLGQRYNDLNGPTSIAVGVDSDIFVVDRGNAGIKVFNHSGALVDIYDGGRLGGIQNFNPAYIAMGKDGILYAADSIAGKVVVLTQRGLLLDQIDLTLEDGSVAQPAYLSISPTGSLFVSAHGALPA